MADIETVLSLQELIASLDKACLPRILQVCSGVYFQGSVYELSGNEVCLSTGDLVKVIDIEPLSVGLEDLSNNEKFELPINHTGLFKLVSEKMPYNTIEEIISLMPVGLDSCLRFTFTSHSELTFETFTLGAGRAMTMLSVEQREDKEAAVRCQVRGQQGSLAEVLVPLSCRGEFYECESEQTFTLQEIVSSLHLRSRKFQFSSTTICTGPLIISPIYQVHAIMHLRKNVVQFPSSLEVDVVDVTAQSQDVTFVSPLTLSEVRAQPDQVFPTMAEILEGPETQPLFRSSWLPHLRKGHHLVIHGKGTSDILLASTLRGRRAQQYFLVSQRYGGRLRRRPREFSSVYELYIASVQAPGLRVGVTRQSEEMEEEGIPFLSVGEQLEVLRCDRLELPGKTCKDQRQTVEALVCRRLPDPDEEDEEDEEEADDEDENKELELPLYMQGHFVERITDKKKYKLKDLGTAFALPLDVKVVSRDAELETDPLVGFPSLRLERATLEPTVQASLPGSPECCFDIPTQWVPMSISFTKDPLPWPKDQPPTFVHETVTEVTESFYYEFHKRRDSNELPPPRPPKRTPSVASTKKPVRAPVSEQDSLEHSPCHKTKKDILSKGLNKLTIDTRKPKRPPAPKPPASSNESPPPIMSRKAISEVKSGKALPNNYVQVDRTDVDSDHDYESVDDNLTKMGMRAEDFCVLLHNQK
ncbi:protein THEMIS2 [Aplochiton taeniatus]